MIQLKVFIKLANRTKSRMNLNFFGRKKRTAKPNPFLSEEPKPKPESFCNDCSQDDFCVHLNSIFCACISFLYDILMNPTENIVTKIIFLAKWCKLFCFLLENISKPEPKKPVSPSFQKLKTEPSTENCIPIGTSSNCR